MHFYPTAERLTGEEGNAFKFTATGDYEGCMDGLATELADWADEPYVKLEIHIYPE